MIRFGKKNRYKNSRSGKWSDALKKILFLAKVAATVAFLVVMSGILIFGHDYLTQCDYFKADRLTIKGNRRLGENELLKQAGIQAGMNILSINLSLARKQLLAHPMVAQASVSRELPSTIVISIEEHVPIAIIDMGKQFLINSHGEVFKKMDSTDPRNLPVIRGLTFSDIPDHGKPTSEPLKAVMAVLHLGRDHKSVMPNVMIQRIDVDREMGLTITTKQNIKTVKIGYDNYREKFHKLDRILSYMTTYQFTMKLDAIDLNNLNRIVVTPTPAGPSDQGRKEA